MEQRTLRDKSGYHMPDRLVRFGASTRFYSIRGDEFDATLSDAEDIDLHQTRDTAHVMRHTCVAEAR